jgi:hypothetical protein
MCINHKYTNLKWEVDYFKLTLLCGLSLQANYADQSKTDKKRITRYEIRENILFVEKSFLYTK